MTFGPEYLEVCISTLSTPVRVRALLTSTPPNNALPSTIYEYEVTSYISSLSSLSIFTNSSVVTIATALAIADPVVVAWQTEDYRFFPSDYASSVAKRFTINTPTSTNSASGYPGPGAKVGIAVGTTIGALALLIGVVLLVLLRRRQSKDRSRHSNPPLAETGDQDRDLAKKKWWIGGRWRNEVQAQADPQELENKTVHVVPGPPAELEEAEVQHTSD